MTTITLELIQTKQAELAEMIQQLKSEILQLPEIILLPQTEINLQPGERYAGAVLGEDGHILHHLVLMAQRPAGRLTWPAAMDWASSVGGRLPNRQEQALLFANCRPYLEPTWYWSCVTTEDESSCAWRCHFGGGGQSVLRKEYEGPAVAVRSITVEA
jgi:hypothetical protein